MASQITVTEAKMFTFDVDAAFRRLVIFYAAKDAAQKGGLEIFVLAYRNALLSMLAQIEIFPNIRTVLFPALLDAVQSAQTFDGAESIFLTYLNSLVASGDKTAFDAAMALWNRFASVSSAPNPDTVDSYDPVLFYNVSTKKLTFLTFDALAQLRPGGTHSDTLQFGPGLGAAIENLGFETASDVFSRQSQRTSSVERASPSAPAKKTQPVKHCGSTLAAVLIGAGVIAEFEPGPGTVVGTILILSGLAIEAVISGSECVDDLTSSVDVQTGSMSVSASDGILVATSDGQVVGTDSNSTVEGGPGPEPGPDPGPEPGPDPGPEPGPDPGPEPGPDPGPEPEPDPEPGPGPEPGPDPGPEPGPDPGPEPEPDPGPEPGPDPEPHHPPQEQPPFRGKFRASQRSKVKPTFSPGQAPKLPPKP